MSQEKIALPSDKPEKPKTVSLPYFQAVLSGLIAGRRTLNVMGQKNFLTLLKLPAADEFSHPSTVEVRSVKPIGVINDRVEVKVIIGGYPNDYRTKNPDPETGEHVSIRSAHNTLIVVEE